MMSDPEKVMFELARDLDKKDAIRAVELLKTALKDLVRDRDELDRVYKERIEQLEAEVESWKNSYEREQG